MKWLMRLPQQGCLAQSAEVRRWADYWPSKLRSKPSWYTQLLRRSRRNSELFECRPLELCS
jgi:hypothetical protein